MEGIEKYANDINVCISPLPNHAEHCTRYDGEFLTVAAEESAAVLAVTFTPRVALIALAFDHEVSAAGLDLVRGPVGKSSTIGVATVTMQAAVTELRALLLNLGGGIHGRTLRHGALLAGFGLAVVLAKLGALAGHHMFGKVLVESRILVFDAEEVAFENLPALGTADLDLLTLGRVGTSRCRELVDRGLLFAIIHVVHAASALYRFKSCGAPASAFRVCCRVAAAQLCRFCASLCATFPPLSSLASLASLPYFRFLEFLFQLLQGFLLSIGTALMIHFTLVLFLNALHVSATLETTSRCATRMVLLAALGKLGAQLALLPTHTGHVAAALRIFKLPKAGKLSAGLLKFQTLR